MSLGFTEILLIALAILVILVGFISTSWRISKAEAKALAVTEAQHLTLTNQAQRALQSLKLCLFRLPTETHSSGMP